MARFARRLALPAYILRLARLPRYRRRVRTQAQIGQVRTSMTTTTESHVATRTIAASPEKIFAFLADPAHHCNTEPTDWVRDAVDKAPITGAGQMFAMNMFLEQAGGHYVTYNLVNVFDQDRAIGWLPGTRDEAGN